MTPKDKIKNKGLQRIWPTGKAHLMTTVSQTQDITKAISPPQNDLIIRSQVTHIRIIRPNDHPVPITTVTQGEEDSMVPDPTIGGPVLVTEVSTLSQMTTQAITSMWVPRRNSQPAVAANGPTALEDMDTVRMDYNTTRHQVITEPQRKKSSSKKV